MFTALFEKNNVQLLLLMSFSLNSLLNFSFLRYSPYIIRAVYRICFPIIRHPKFVFTFHMVMIDFLALIVTSFVSFVSI